MQIYRQAANTGPLHLWPTIDDIHRSRWYELGRWPLISPNEVSTSSPHPRQLRLYGVFFDTHMVTDFGETESDTSVRISFLPICRGELVPKTMSPPPFSYVRRISPDRSFLILTRQCGTPWKDWRALQEAMQLGDPSLDVVESFSYSHSCVRRLIAARYKPTLREFVMRDQIRIGAITKVDVTDVPFVSDEARQMLSQSAILRLVLHLKVIAIDFFTASASRALLRPCLIIEDVFIIMKRR